MNWKNVFSNTTTQPLAMKGDNVKKLIAILVCVLIAFILFGTAYARFAKPGEAIRYRKAVMTLIQQHFKDMGDVVKGKVTYDPATFTADAEVVKLLATLPWGAFMEPGSDKGKTKMSSAVFKKKMQFDETASNFEAATAEMAATAQSGNLKDIRGKYMEVAQVCGSCHKNFKK
jgi:cytochrome c556